jgi:hypothetical protein
LQEVNGSLGLGVTPSAWFSGWKAVEIGSGNAIWTVSGQDFRISSNLYNDGSNSIYKANGAASFYNQGSGTHNWYTAPSGTAGNAISFTQAMTLDASGNLLVGGTTALGSASGRGNITINGASTSIISLGTAGAWSGYVYHDSTNMSVSNVKSGSLFLATGDVTRLAITSTGNVGIGTTSPSEKLHVSGNIRVSSGSYKSLTSGGLGNIGFASGKIGSTSFGGLFGPAITYNAQYNGSIWQSIGGGNASAITIDEGVFSFANSQGVGAGGVTLTWTDRLVITSGGNVLINTTTDAGFRLDVNGTARATAFFTSSDKRKKDIISQDGDLAIYRFKGDSQIHYGYIAQDMQALYPHQVITDNDGMLSLNYIEILVKKVHDLESKLKRHGLD